MGIAKLQGVSLGFFNGAVFEISFAGDTVKVERKHPLLQIVHGWTLVDDAVNLDIA